MSILYHFHFNNSKTERFFDDLTMGLLYALNSVMGVENVMAVVNEGLSPEEIFEWQREVEYPLPNDLISFYSLINGIHITWGYKMRNSALKVGLIKIESLYDLKPLGYFRNSGDDGRQDLLTNLDLISGNDQPKFNTDFKIIQLEYTRDSSTVCLVYSVIKRTHTIWLLDRSLQWHYITDSFTKYFYMMVKHAGLPQWQMGQTVLGMAMWAKQLLYTFALCLQSPPTSGLHSWLVDPSRAQASYVSAFADPTTVKFLNKKSIDYAGYFSVEAPVLNQNDVTIFEDSPSIDETKAFDATLSNLEPLPNDESDATTQENSVREDQDITDDRGSTFSHSSLKADLQDKSSLGSSDDSFTTTKP
ncbi:hypothetical protein GE061_005627 [Apolygus lucorum]|uniref:Knr4/Smi1-like domain-containing protein n=1 Tax=Apolygus lucorum TaxID=248454 RepID=A0A6A4IMM0_APOLU|nr:hypothetical protein GE061_005627 [Apolygus lucorum]